MTGAEWADPGDRLYGRDHELAWCGRLLAQLGAGRGGSSVVTGDPGLGRTALLRHLAGTFTGGTACYVPAVPPRDVRDGVLGQLYAGHPAGRLRSALLSAAGTRPLLVCVDDLHLWPDSPRAALHTVARGLAAEPAPVALILSVAAHRVAGLAGDLPVLRLGPLDDEAAGALLERLLADRPVPPAVRRRLLDAAAGSPLVLQELVAGLEGAGRPGDPPGGRHPQAPTGPAPGEVVPPDTAAEPRLLASVPPEPATGSRPLAAGPRPLAAGPRLLAAEPHPLAGGRHPLAGGPHPLAAGPHPLAGGRLSPAPQDPPADDRIPQALRLVAAAERAWLEGWPERAVRLLAPVRRLALPDSVTGQAELVHGLVELGEGPIGDARASLLLAARRLAAHDPAQALR
ncbi:hypothetical protein ABT367_30175, partial [Streptomyces mesophilus]